MKDNKIFMGNFCSERRAWTFTFRLLIIRQL